MDQNLDRQLAAVGAVERVFQDKKSGRNRDARPGLSSLLRHVRGGDPVRVASMDRLARSVVDLAQLVDERTDRAVRVEFVKERLTFDAAEATDFMATFQLHVMGAFAEMERAVSKDRQRGGIDLARARGAYLGRPKRLTDVDIVGARHLVSQGVPKAVVGSWGVDSSFCMTRCTAEARMRRLFERAADGPRRAGSSATAVSKLGRGE